MSSSPSHLLRSGLKGQLSAWFNAALAGACGEMLIGDLAFAVNFAEAPGLPHNFFEPLYDYDALFAQLEPDLPAMCLAIGAGQDQALEKPTKFAGRIPVHLRFFLIIPALYEPDLTGADRDDRKKLMILREAVESALVDTLSLDIGGGVIYTRDLSWETLALQRFDAPSTDQFTWVQQIDYTATFEVTL